MEWIFLGWIAALVIGAIVGIWTIVDTVVDTERKSRQALDELIAKIDKYNQ